MDIAIFGAGIAGLTTAIALRTHGHTCRVFERNRQAHEAGMGFILVPEAITCLESFGVHLASSSVGTPLHRYYCRGYSGQIISEQNMPAGARAIRRRDLMATLVEALGEQSSLGFDVELEGFEFTPDFRVKSARLSSGVTTEVHADLYIGAEGIHSKARQALFPGWPAAYAQVPEIVGLVHSPKAVRWAAYNFNKFHAESGGIAVGVLPVDAEHVVWYLQFDAQRFPLPQEIIEGEASRGASAQRAFVEELVGHWANPIPSLLAMTDFTRVHLWHPIQTDLVPYFHRGNLTLVGDAAHPLSPFTSQGVSSAISDAVVLARELDTVKSKDDLAGALERYSSERREQCAPYVAKGRELLQHFLEPLSLSSDVLPIAIEISM